MIVRGVNVFPTAVREVVNEFSPAVSGAISIRPRTKGVKQQPPLHIAVELAEGIAGDSVLAENIRKRIRDKLVFTGAIDLVPWGTLPRTDYKSKLVDWSAAQ